MKTVSVVLAGIGGYGRLSVMPLLKDAPDHGAKLVACVDPFPEKCQFIGELRAAGVPIYPSLEAFYAEMHADLAVLATPIHLHCAQAVCCMERGSHVLCEKPVCSILPDAEIMAEAEVRLGKSLHIGYQWSHSAAVTQLKADIAAGLLGRPKYMKTLICWPRSKAYFARGWAAKWRAADGSYILDSIAMNATAHYIHNMLYLLGDAPDKSAEPRTVTAETYRVNSIESFDTAALRIITEDGTPLFYVATHGCDQNFGPVFEYVFENATVTYDEMADGRFTARFSDGSTRDYGSPADGPLAKLWNAIDTARGEGRKYCGVEASVPHLRCINGLAENVPVHTILREKLTYDEKKELLYMPGLSDALKACYTDMRLPSEAGLSFARPAVSFNVRPGYTFNGLLED
ncbi:MAG: Gfo/Idh/MocA family oxidoreductase [Clostridia bacterium]|nr:Gfo/Idh/MocA family oxidoreductase [Clostridia bacterium]